MNPDPNLQERLFFALWPPTSVRLQMMQCLRDIPDLKHHGRPVKQDNLHMTVHFLGNIDVERIDCYIQQAKSVSLRPFELQLDTAGYFKKPKVLWLGCEEIPSRLIQFHTDLAMAIKNCGYISEARKYHPHITMARKIKEPLANQSIATIKWSVEEFVLVKSVTYPTGVEYTVRDRFRMI
jgi:RNA 2',3'-cyclic 3'-phosphodiesterase